MGTKEKEQLAPFNSTKYRKFRRNQTPFESIHNNQPEIRTQKIHLQFSKFLLPLPNEHRR